MVQSQIQEHETVQYAQKEAEGGVEKRNICKVEGMKKAIHA